MSKDKKIRSEWLEDNNDGPYACYTVGHVPLKDHLKSANENWSDDWADKENTFYQYLIEDKSGARPNVKPTFKRAIPVTISYWEEPYPEQK